MVLNTCHALEDVLIDLEYAGEEIFAVGPLNPLLDASARMPGQPRHECLD
jgi:cis-zeatin O-glucosyltransferase